MNSSTRLIVVAVLVFLAIAVADSFFTRHAVAAVAPPPEQYLIVSTVRGETDAQLVARLNVLGADGWTLRCSIPNGVIFAR